MRRRRVPQRTCIACRQVKPARELIRIVRLPSGEVEVDDRGKKSGRGAYLCPSKACWETESARKLVEHALKTKITNDEAAAVLEYCRSLPSESL